MITIIVRLDRVGGVSVAELVTQLVTELRNRRSNPGLRLEAVSADAQFAAHYHRHCSAHLDYLRRERFPG